VQVRNNYWCQAYDTIKIKVFCASSQVFVPNAFTPDGDGLNDILMVRGIGIVTVKSFRIFNRWGELVFERSNFPPNDPTYGSDGKVRE
jgi:gliding motility-associated-like protein